MRIRHLASAGALALGLACASSPAWAGSLKVLSVDQKGMVVVEQPSVRHVGDQVSATVLTVSNHGYLPLAYYQTPRRSSISVACGAQTFSLDNGASHPITADSAVSRTADWLCKGVAPSYAVEVGDFSAIGAAYLGYVSVTPGVFFVYY